MFFKLVFRNSVRSHKENALFMGSLIISIIAFYVVLSLDSQDVMRYLKSLESEAISKLFAMISVLYGFTL
ncbi:MAG: ABC transporter permease, partial [Clostridiales bacterium]|nr:ABC transporter permease [Clostridiales bacterium]